MWDTTLADLLYLGSVNEMNFVCNKLKFYNHFACIQVYRYTGIQVHRALITQSIGKKIQLHLEKVMQPKIWHQGRNT